MEFWKGQALGNDYLVVDGTGESGLPEPVVRGLCDRHRGPGGDGVLVADLDADPIGLRIFNPDGSEAEKSGNGLRIFGAWLHGRGLAGDAPFRVALPIATVEMRVESSAEDGTLRLRVDMGRASTRAGDIPFTEADPDAEVRAVPVEIGGERIELNPVSMGNPHCVVFLDDLDMDRFRRLAPQVQAYPAFARGVNVQFARPLGAATLDARIWERGVGETLASGSSACAVAVAALRAGLVRERDLEVRMPGGSVRVEVDDDWRVRLTGDAQIVYRGDVPAAVVDGWR